MIWNSVFDTLPTVEVLAIGNFDGVHLGHQAVLARAQEASRGRAVGVLVPDPHPSTILSAAPMLLTDMQERGRLLAAKGAGVLLKLPFDTAVAQWEPEEFVQRVVLGAVRPRAVVVGFNFTFGRGALAGAQDLGRLLAPHGIAFSEAKAVVVDGLPVSSSRIRAALEEGRVDFARRLLGRPHAVRGVVRPGQGRGRTIGFPTANVHLPQGIALPVDGVYAVQCQIGDDEVPGVANLGSRPTFNEQERLLEVHLFDISQDLYDREMAVGFSERIRGQMRFSSVEELRRQIALDSLQAKEMLGVAGA